MSKRGTFNKLTAVTALLVVSWMATACGNGSGHSSGGPVPGDQNPQGNVSFPQQNTRVIIIRESNYSGGGNNGWYNNQNNSQRPFGGVEYAEVNQMQGSLQQMVSNQNLNFRYVQYLLSQRRCGS